MYKYLKVLITGKCIISGCRGVGVWFWVCGLGFGSGVWDSLRGFGVLV